MYSIIHLIPLGRFDVLTLYIYVYICIYCYSGVPEAVGVPPMEFSVQCPPK